LAGENTRTIDAQYITLEEPTRHDQLARSGLEPLIGVVVADAAAQLHAPGPRAECAARGVVVARAEPNHVAAAQVVVAVAARVVGGVLVGHEVLVGTRPIAAQARADDLLDAAVVEIDAGAKEGHHGILPDGCWTRVAMLRRLAFQPWEEERCPIIPATLTPQPCGAVDSH